MLYYIVSVLTVALLNSTPSAQLATAPQPSPFIQHSAYAVDYIYNTAAAYLMR